MRGDPPRALRALSLFDFYFLPIIELHRSVQNPGHDRRKDLAPQNVGKEKLNPSVDVYSNPYALRYLENAHNNHNVLAERSSLKGF